MDFSFIVPCLFVALYFYFCIFKRFINWLGRFKSITRAIGIFALGFCVKVSHTVTTGRITSMEVERQYAAFVS